MRGGGCVIIHVEPTESSGRRANEDKMHNTNAAPSTGAMTVAEFLSWARIGRTTFYREAAAGRIKLRKIGAKTVVLRDDALAWLNGLPAA